MNFILGSGILGLLAKVALGDQWCIIPFGRSRFYSFNPPIGDNYIIRNEFTADLFSRLGFSQDIQYINGAYSYNGELIFSNESFAKYEYIDKLFATDPHPLAKTLLRIDFMAHSISIYELYHRLLERYKSEILENNIKYGDINNITDHIISTTTGKYQYTKIISTLPLPTLNKYSNLSSGLSSRDMWYYHVTTPLLNFENAKFVLVGDKPYDFHKVVNIGPQEYIFHCLKDLVNPIQYLGMFVNNQLKLLNSTFIPQAIPIGMPPNISNLEQMDIYPVGCHGQHDYFMDLASSIKRLYKMKL